jgi:fucose 4-O-acetylase-like acetyltransferase
MLPTDLRSKQIDTLRGLACLLLVLYHVVGNSNTSGLDLERSHGLVLLNEVFSYLRMPLFSVLSGYIYALRPYRQNAGAFVLGKARRLLVPMFVVGTAFALLQAAVPGTSFQIADWHTLHIVPVAHYWFLESLFLIFVVIVGLEHVHALSTRSRLSVVLGIAAITYMLEPLPVYFGMAGAVYLFPFVLFGLWCGRFNGVMAGGPRLQQLQLGLLVSLVVIEHAVIAGYLLPDAHSLSALILGFCGCLMLLRSRMNWKWLAWVGRYSFAIFLFHVFGSAAAHIALTKAGVDSLYLLLPIGMVAGVFVPILAVQMLKKVPFAPQWVLGESPPQRVAEAKQDSTIPAAAALSGSENIASSSGLGMRLKRARSLLPGES